MTAVNRAGEHPLAALWMSYTHRRYALLFYTLVTTLVAAPISSALGFQQNVIDVFLAIALLAAVLPMGQRPGAQLALVGLFVCAVAARIGMSLGNDATLAALSFALWAVIALTAAASALLFAIRSQEVEREHVYAALSAYLLAGLFFGVIHWALEQAQPGSYSFPGKFTHISSYYFSFITLATIGFGDILPRSDVARGLTIIEGIGGQLFLAVLVARLVSQHRKGRDSA